MLTHLKLDNFKIWRATGPMRLAPLTLLLGTNSSGKSSLIQSLLLIRQTIKGEDPNLDLNLGNPDTNDSVTLGQFKDLLCRHGNTTSSTPANQVGIEFRWKEDDNISESTLFSARYRRGTGGSAELDYLRMGNSESSFTVQRTKPGIYGLKLPRQRKAIGRSADYRPARSFAFSAATINQLGKKAAGIEKIAPRLLDELSRIIYLGPVRRLAQRDYVWTGRMPAHIGDDGAKAIDALIASGVAKQKALKRKRKPPIEAELFDNTIRWLKAMNLAHGLQLKALGNSARHELIIQSYDEAINIKDVGVGVSQVLPVIVAALFAAPGHIVIIEEPESHLHPLAQSQLAELFATVRRERGVQFVVETHSEHLFRRMQTLIAKQELSNTDCTLYFVERDGKHANLRTLEADELGRVRNWPKFFFGDSMGETRVQTEMAIKKAKELRNKDGEISR